jgi:hypothetical protein
VKAVLKFNLPEEQSEHRLALDGWKWRSVVSDIADKLRSALKYDDDLTPETDACLEKLREEVFPAAGRPRSKPLRRMSGKGDTPRAVNGTLFRRNWDGIFMMKPKQYPDWICNQCGRLHGKRPEGNSVATYHIGRCGVCGTGGIEVTEPRDFGHLREGWDK